jgi:N6-L-threonylcarbamoyladenine synthase
VHTILAIETSCDDTSIAVLHDGILLSNITYGQEVHAKYGGVVPEEASRMHMQNIYPVMQAALQKADKTLSDITAIAVTSSPGLLGSLMVGVNFAKGLAHALNIPLIGVNHMQAHVLSNLLMPEAPKFPFLCLTVSGGHTQIVHCTSATQMNVVGTTIDDAAGEAFDKVAKMLGLPYPGGPLVDKHAQLGDSIAYQFAKPQIADLNFSFSGVKTSVLYFLQKAVKENPNFIEQNLNNICASVQRTIVDILVAKIKKASKQFNISTICLAGGVSANSGLRAAMQYAALQYDWQVHIPDMQFCTDNGAMIGITAHHMLQQGVQASSLNLSPSARSVI